MTDLFSGGAVGARDKLIESKDAKKSERVMAAMLNMSKLDIETLEAAAKEG